MLNLNVHIHALTSDGLFAENGVFTCMPSLGEKARICLQKLFEKKVIGYLLKYKLCREKTIKMLLSWKHSGFSVYIDTRVNYTIYHEEEAKKLKKILKYMNKSFYSQERVIYKEGNQKVLYKGEYHKGLKRNFETLSPVDFVAAVTAHIPEKHQKYVNYYGYYSSKTRGMRKKTKEKSENESIIKIKKESSESQRIYKKKWAVLIKKVYETNPLECPKCGTEMRIISYIDDKAVIKRILQHLKLWDVEDARMGKKPNKAPPEITSEVIEAYIREPFHA